MTAPMFRSVCQHTGEVATPPVGETRTLEVKLVLEAVMCDHCDTAFGIPKWLDGAPFYCPLGHRNAARSFDGGVR